MAVPSSGQLRLRGDIALEVDGSATGSNVSLQALSRSAGKSTPDGMLEFYGYSASVPPTVTTSSSSSTNTSVYMTGTVNSDGGATITERGFYFGTSTNPTSNPKYVVAGTTGNFNFNKTGLSTNATYRYFAYATNASGTTIGAMQTRATYPTLNYSWVSYNAGYPLEITMLYFTCTYMQWYGYNVMNHPYLGGITYSSGTATTYDGSDYNQLNPIVTTTVGKITTAGYNSSQSIYVRARSFSPSSWQATPTGGPYNGELTTVKHPSSVIIGGNNPHIISYSFSNYQSTGTLWSASSVYLEYKGTGGYFSEASGSMNLGVSGG